MTTPYAVGDQVRIVSGEHPWKGEVGRIVRKWSDEAWIVEFESGIRSATYEDEMQRV